MQHAVASMIHLHFFGLGDVLRRFELEQLTGLTLMGFRPVTLDGLVLWSHHVATQHHWDSETVQKDVCNLWLEKAEEISVWRQRLQHSSDEMTLLAGIGDERTWRQHWESMLRQTPLNGGS